MYRLKIKFAMAILLAILGFATVQIRAEIPIVQADTVFAGFGGGSVSGIVFGPDGNTVILMHNTIPTEIDIKTHKVLREFEAVPNATGEEPHLFFNKQKKYIGGTFNSSKYFDGNIFNGEIIWDYLTGKIIKAIPNILLLTDCNMEKFYTYFNHNFCSFDINTFNKVDSISLPKDMEGFGYVDWGTIGIIPNSNKVLISAARYALKENGDREYSLCELYVLDFDTKKITKVAIPYEIGQSKSSITKIVVTETGKYNVVGLKISEYDKYYFFFDENFNFLFKEASENLRHLVNCDYFGYNDIDITINDNYLLVAIIETDEHLEGSILYDIKAKQGMKLLNHFPGTSFNKITNKIAMADESGSIGLFDLISLPVEENKTLNNSKDIINYQNSSLIINTETVGNVEINITDYNGNLLQTQKDVLLYNGINTIKLKTPLGIGVYFCVIKSSTGNNSFKFMVNK